MLYGPPAALPATGAEALPSACAESAPAELPPAPNASAAAPMPAIRKKSRLEVSSPFRCSSLIDSPRSVLVRFRSRPPHHAKGPKRQTRRIGCSADDNSPGLGVPTRKSPNDRRVAVTGIRWWETRRTAVAREIIRMKGIAVAGCLNLPSFRSDPMPRAQFTGPR